MKDGQPVQQWAFGVAFPKNEFAPIWAAMSQEAATGYPQGTPPKFAWKYQDGDGIDSNGQPFNKREGYAGCFILTITTEAFAPPIYKFQNGAYVQLNADQIKTGDYVAVALNIKVNVPTDRTHTPGLYINPEAIDHVGYGQEIHNGPDPMALFGGQQRQLPPGASATPIASNGGVAMPGTGPTMQPGPSTMPMQQPGQMPGQPQMQYQQPGPQTMPGAPQPGPQTMPGAPQPGYQQPAPGYTPPHDPRFTGGQQQPIQPAHDFVQNAGNQQPMQTNGGYYAPPQGQQPMPGMMPPNR
jgi:hypothetical protein